MMGRSVLDGEVGFIHDKVMKEGQGELMGWENPTAEGKAWEAGEWQGTRSGMRSTELYYCKHR